MKLEQMEIPPEVERFLEDAKALGIVNDENGWHITEEWASKFRKHLENMLPLAEKGNPVAQYNVAAIYMCNYIHSSEQSAIDSYEDDVKEMSKWLEQAARGGVLTAIDNLISSGVGEEAERLRGLYKIHQSELEKTPPPLEGWERDMKRLFSLAYENS